MKVDIKEDTVKLFEPDCFRCVKASLSTAVDKAGLAVFLSEISTVVVHCSDQKSRNSSSKRKTNFNFYKDSARTAQ